ncbi:MAG: exodeoxyribonuclease VII small subunit [bacterium]|nr:exodeoxyribonuclease VII small subunit [bacterium]
MAPPEQNFGKLMQQLQEIVDWYERQEELDLEEGLTKAKQAAELIRLCSQRLGQLENEFVKIKADLETASGPAHNDADTAV